MLGMRGFRGRWGWVYQGNDQDLRGEYLPALEVQALPMIPIDVFLAALVACYMAPALLRWWMK
jgi:hypothetical protein